MKLNSEQWGHILEAVGVFDQIRIGRLRWAGRDLHVNNAQVKSLGQEFEFSFECSRDLWKKIEVGETLKKVKLEADSGNYFISDLYIRRNAHPTFTCYSGNIHTEGYTKSVSFYYRLLIPLDRKITLRYILNAEKADLAEESIQFQLVSDEQANSFLLLQSATKQAYREFADKTFAVINAIAYLTGHFAGGYGYYLAYGSRSMLEITHINRREFRRSIYSLYTPVYSNPFGTIRDRRSSNRYYNRGLLRPMNESEFSKLVLKLLDVPNFTAALLLIVESSTASLLYMPTGFAVALEILADIVKPKKRDSQAPIEKEIAKDIRLEMKDLIEGFTDRMTQEAHTIINKRIDNINSPTNRTKLKAPFVYLKINLTEDDELALESRNKLLHGMSFDIDKKDVKALEEQGRVLHEISMRLYTLLSMLILKWVGYENYVVNQAKNQLEYNGTKIREDHYRKV
jgi:hypothetical protein